RKAATAAAWLKAYLLTSPLNSLRGGGHEDHCSPTSSSVGCRYFFRGPSRERQPRQSRVDIPAIGASTLWAWASVKVLFHTTRPMPDSAVGGDFRACKIHPSREDRGSEMGKTCRPMAVARITVLWQ